MPTTATQDLGIQVTVASQTTSPLGLSIDVSTVEFTSIPTAHNIHNQFDEFGLLLGLKRLPGEVNRDYKARLMDVYVNRASSVYRGLINGITRELGLELTPEVVLTVSRAPDGSPIGTNPVLEIAGPEVRVWADIEEDEEPAQTIDRYEMTLSELVAEINTGTIFTAALYSWRTDGFLRAMRLLNQTTMVRILRDASSGRTRFSLRNENIIQSTDVFSDRIAFRNRVASVAAVSAAGDYHLDYVTGRVTVFTPPEAGNFARYRYFLDDYDLISSPVIIHNLQSDEFRRRMFAAVLQDDGSTALGMTTELGADLINEILSVYPMYYGE